MKSIARPIANLRLINKFHLAMVFMAISFLVSGIFAWVPMGEVDKQWHDYQSQVAARQSLLSEMKSQLGYGGAIHNFRNYVIRGKDKYGERFLSNYQTIGLLLDGYQRLGDLNVEERNSLVAIRIQQHAATWIYSAFHSVLHFHQERCSSTH